MTQSIYGYLTPRGTLVSAAGHEVGTWAYVTGTQRIAVTTPSATYFGYAGGADGRLFHGRSKP